MARVVVALALAYASAVALTDWAIRTKRLSPIGRWQRFIRGISEPVTRPLEQRVIRAGGNPVDAPFWLFGLVVVGGLVLLWFIGWVGRPLSRYARMIEAGPAGWILAVVTIAYYVLTVAIFIRVIASWFGVGRFNRWMRPVMALTDWIVEPIRRVLPTFGRFDLSPLAAWLLILLARTLVVMIIIPLIPA
ncbi:MAG: YggT family protein [Gemmatimonadales bacterium]|nr:YggT family protein [Gemmatimonadales bacterium]